MSNLNQFYAGMAVQAIVTAVLWKAGIVKATPMQQALAFVLFIIMAIVMRGT